MAFTMNNKWKEPVFNQPALTGQQMLELAKQNPHKLMLTWKEGAVLLYRGEELVKEITKFRPVGIKDHSTVKSKNTWCWEGAFKEITDLQGKSIDSIFKFRADRAKYYTYYVGIRPTKFLEMYNACMMKAFIPQDLRDEANKYCRERLGRFNPRTTNIFIKNADHFRQLKKDNMGHMIPLFLQTAAKSYKEMLSVSDMRKSIGKSNWKTLLKNSPSRNKLIAHNLHNNNYCDWNYNTDYRTILTHLNKLPSGMLPRNVMQSVPEIESVALFRRMKIVGDRKKQERINQYISDSKRMTEQLGRKMPKGSSSWSYNQWKEYHEKVTELVNLKKYSRDVFPWIKPYTQNFKSEKYTAEILNNAFDIKMEGEVMKHCVASYSGQASKGDYMVVSLKDVDNERYSTLGLYVRNGKITFNQHYKHCNARVDCEGAVKFAESIVKTLNKEHQEFTKGNNYDETEKTF